MCRAVSSFSLKLSRHARIRVYIIMPGEIMPSDYRDTVEQKGALDNATGVWHRKSSSSTCNPSVLQTCGPSLRNGADLCLNRMLDGQGEV